MVAGILVVIVAACGLLASALERGWFVENALTAASHHVGMAAGWASDAFCY